jgi:hypothetical protein
MPTEVWYLALLLLVAYAQAMISLAPRWDREAPSDPESSVGKFSDLDPLTVPPHPPHTQR